MLLEQLLPHKSLPSKEELMSLSAGLILPTTWLTDLSSLSYIGVFGVLSAFGLTGIVAYEFFQNGLEVRRIGPFPLQDVFHCIMHRNLQA